MLNYQRVNQSIDIGNTSFSRPSHGIQLRQVQLSCGNSSPAPPAPVLLRRPSNDGTAPAWKVGATFDASLW